MPNTLKQPVRLKPGWIGAVSIGVSNRVDVRAHDVFRTLQVYGKIYSQDTRH